MSREALVLLVCCCDFRDGAERLIPSKSLRNAVIRAFPGLFRILRMCAPRRAAAVVRPCGREKSADRRRRILISRLLIIRASVPRRKSPFPAYFKGFPAVSPLIPPYPAFLKYPVSPQRAQMAGIFAFAVPEEWYTEPNASLVTSAYASREYIADVTDKTPYRSEILLMYRRGLLSGMDAKGSFYPDRSVSRVEIAALLTRVVKPETRLTLTWTVAPYHSVKNATLASLVKAPASTSLPTSAKDTAAIDGLVRNMLARGEHTITLNYSKALTTATASALTQAFTSCVKTYCEQMYNAVSCRSYSTGKVVLTFSSTACMDKTLESYRAKALAAAIKVHDSLWESGTLSYDMSQYEIARTYFQWLCDHCRYDNAAADDSASHLAYGALVSGLAVCDGYTGAYNLLLKLEGIECTSLFNDSHIWTLATLDGTQYHIDVTWGDQYGRTDLRYFGMSEEQSYQYHPWNRKK